MQKMLLLIHVQANVLTIIGWLVFTDKYHTAALVIVIDGLLGLKCLTGVDPNGTDSMQMVSPWLSILHQKTVVEPMHQVGLLYLTLNTQAKRFLLLRSAFTGVVVTVDGIPTYQ